MSHLTATGSSFVYRHLLKPFFFRRDPEEVHDRMIRLGERLGKHRLSQALVRASFSFKHPSLQQTLCGLHFRNPIGLSTGFDKNAQLINILPDVGFGYMNVGTVTFKPYAGNPRPRLYRLPLSKALIVYYGLKNDGVEQIAARIAAYHAPRIPLGISFARTNCQETRALDAGIEDTRRCLEQLMAPRVGDYHTLNISCPNTFGGEPFTQPDRLRSLLQALFTLSPSRPFFIKMPINLAWTEFQSLLDVILEFPVQGVIIGNLNKNHHDKHIHDVIPSNIKGGISGQPTRTLSNELISRTYQYCGQKLMIIGVGGIFNAHHAYEKIKRGASLVQLITGMIYQGPQLIGEINRQLVKFVQRDGYENIHEAIGSY